MDVEQTERGGGGGSASSNREVSFIDTAGGQTNVGNTTVIQLFTEQAAIVGASFITAVGGFPTATFEVTEAGTLFIQGSVGTDNAGTNGCFRMTIEKQDLGVGAWNPVLGTRSSSGQLDNGDGEEGNVTSFCLEPALVTDRFRVIWARREGNGTYTTKANYSRLFFSKKS